MANTMVSWQSKQQTMKVVQPGVEINAFGRGVRVGDTEAKSIMAIEEALQRELLMQGQAFHLFDAKGSHLTTDAELKSAVAAGRVPLSANLSEASVHYIESRREELSQMQWKLLRDQLTGVDSKLQELTFKLQAVSDGFNGHMHDHPSIEERLRNDCARMVQDAKETERLNFMRLNERIEAVSHLHYSERNLREAMKEGMGKQIQGCRDAFEADRQSRNQDLSVTQAAVNDSHQTLRQVLRATDAQEERHLQTVTSIHERIDSLSKAQVDHRQDADTQLRELHKGASTKLEDHNNHVVHLRASIESSQLDAAGRFQRMDDRIAGMERLVFDTMGKLETKHTLLQDRADKVTQKLDDANADAVRRRFGAGENIGSGAMSPSCTSPRVAVTYAQSPTNANTRMRVMSSGASVLVSPPATASTVPTMQTVQRSGQRSPAHSPPPSSVGHRSATTSTATPVSPILMTAMPNGNLVSPGVTPPMTNFGPALLSPSGARSPQGGGRFFPQQRK